ncbi:hypothetical protein [Microbacterium sp. MM2322]|uniref:SLOG domain-containing protein n=1 Tax=Microbacterium sp. MM2322 TaxID=3157631 RepID=UPI0032D56CF1
MRGTRAPVKGSIFLSGSIPDAARWQGDFEPLEITDAVVAFARACLTREFRIVTAAHPTLAPLLMYVAAEFPSTDEARIVIYQSQLFETVLPTATRRFEADGVGELIWTEAVAGDEPTPGHWEASLREMRSRMLTETNPLAAVFIGGMEGVREEFSRFSDLFPGRPKYAVRRPGGEAAQLSLEAQRASSSVSDAENDISYPTLWNGFLRELDPDQRQ